MSKKSQARTPPAELILRMYRQMVAIRAFEEQAGKFYAAGEMPGMVHLSAGQEAVAVGVCGALKRDDYITSNHRGHGHCLAKGARADRLFAELLGKAPGYSKGKGGSMHVADFPNGNLGTTGIVGGGIALAVGAGLSARRRGTRQVAVSFFGDGALNQGILFESMNMAAIWAVPVVFVCENNLYGEFTAAREVSAGSQYTSRGEVFDIPSLEVDGMDVLAVYDATARAVARARGGKGPTFLVCNTYRFGGHHAGDQKQAYRLDKEREKWEKRDPIPGLGRWLTAKKLAPPRQLEQIRLEVEKETQQAADFARAAPFPEPETVGQEVYAT